MATTDEVPMTPKNHFYEVRAIPGKGFGCFALKDLKRGTRILADSPLLIVPMADYLQEDIQAAFDKLTPREKELYFSLHSGHGQDPRNWPSQIHPSVDGKERTRIEQQHAARTGKEPTLISIFQTNCMEMNKGAAVFPHASRFNHACNPNACFTWNAGIGKETIHIMNDVKAGTEITLSYCDMLHDTKLRSWELKHYGFVCGCPACAEDEDDENTYAYQSADRRFRLQELDRETRMLRRSRLDEGAKVPDFATKLVQMAALHQQDGDFSARLASVFLDIALVCELKDEFKFAKIAAVKAVQTKRDCQGEDFPEFPNYVDVLHRIEQKLAMQGA
ncbi:SET domain-containing protein [Plenodomus tracheiphilus IPT5]|uniref:SET domain-containing protein n=1 Tax=Plenodomus tracheiphilus IPT5 TaxID=1408161 RepID=A0A6A7B8A9_9PLEO|nr:SET domain-containing protein [Plenodomus tracheiphilus IPT5]